nr:KGG domain-containing protein [Rickettsia felis]
MAAKEGHASHGGHHGHNDHDHGSGKQGFASMDKEKVREIAAKGGHASHKGSH